MVYTNSGRGLTLPDEVREATSFGEVCTAMHIPATGEMETGCSRFGATLWYAVWAVLCLLVVLPFIILLLVWTPFLYLFSSCNDKGSFCREAVNRFTYISLWPVYCFVQVFHPEKESAKGAMQGRL